MVWMTPVMIGGWGRVHDPGQQVLQDERPDRQSEERKQRGSSVGLVWRLPARPFGRGTFVPLLYI